MSNSAEEALAPVIIPLCDDRGRTFDCEILDIAELDRKQYCVLRHVPDDPDEEGAIVILRLIMQDDHSEFQTLDEIEFQRVESYVVARAFSN